MRALVSDGASGSTPEERPAWDGHLTTTDYHPSIDPDGSRASLVCSICGYGVVRAVPPERCPMCQQRSLWLTHTGRRSKAL